MSKAPIVVYTCITGGYDDLHAPRRIEQGIDYVCVTDGKVGSTTGWRLLPLPLLTGTNADKNRYVKMHPHVLFPQYEVSVYVDGNIEIVGGLNELIRSALQDSDIALYRHSFRTNVYQEAAVCAGFGHAWWWQAARQMHRYRMEGLPLETELFEANIIIRRHSSLQVLRLMESWWNEYNHGIKRDQVSLPYSAWKTSTNIGDLGSSDSLFEQSHFILNIGHKMKPKLIQRIRGLINRKLLMRFVPENIIDPSRR
jgi:hypothetical protein